MHPYPPFELATRVLAMPNSFNGFVNYEIFGSSTRYSLLELLPDDWSFEGKRMLDFGCGAGRTLRHFIPDAESAEFWGVDIDARSIDWIEQNLIPPLHVKRCQTEPPLDFEAASFDLAWAISVFTHLTDSSPAWLLEMHRLLKPGGLLMASYMGEWNAEAITGESWDEDGIGMNALQHNRTWDLGGPMVLMSDWWVREHWGRAFEIVELEPRIHNQTWVLLRKKDVEITVDELLEPGEDPREFLALRNNLTQLQREIEDLERQLHEAREAAARATPSSEEQPQPRKLTDALRSIPRRIRGG